MSTQPPPKRPPPAFLMAACTVHHGLQSAPAETDHANDLRRHSRKLDHPERLEQQLDELLDAAKRLQARGFFAPVSCADEETLKDMAAMRAAIAKAGCTA